MLQKLIPDSPSVDSRFNQTNQPHPCRFVSELLSGRLAGVAPPPLSAKETTGIPPVDFLKRNKKALLLAGYGFFLSAPISHVALAVLQRLFDGKTKKSKFLQILTSNLTVSPIQQSIYLVAMAWINGARTPDQIFRVWKSQFLKVMRLTWVISTLSIIVAQRYLEPTLWVPFFSLVGATAGTFVNVSTKLAAKARAQAKSDADDAADSEEKKTE